MIDVARKFHAGVGDGIQVDRTPTNEVGIVIQVARTPDVGVRVILVGVQC